MSTPEINLQLDNFLEQKGLLGTAKPSVGPPSPTIQQSLNTSLDSFLKYKGFQLPGDLPNEKPPEPTPEMRGYMAKEFQPGKPTPPFVSTPPTTEGEPPKIEMTPGLEPTFWKQAKDLALAWAKGKIGAEDLVGVDFFKGLTLGNADPYAIVEKISGKPGFKQFAETATRARIASAVGYEPKGAVAFAGGASRAMGNVVALAPILKGAQVTAKLLPAIPMLRAAARGVVAGALTGVIEKPEDEGVWNRIKQIPPNVLFFTAFETLGVTAEQMLKIFKWNKEWGRVSPEAKVEYVSKEVPGKTTEFTPDQMKELFRKMNANAAGTGGDWSRLTPQEQEVVNVASKAPGWKQAIKEGFFQQGAGQTIYGAKVTPELIPRKPQMGDLFRNEANLPRYQPTIAEQEMWPSKWPREGQPSPVEPPIPGESAAGPTATPGTPPPQPSPPPSGAKAGPKVTPSVGGGEPQAVVPVGKTTINIRPQADGSIKVDVEPRVPWPTDELWKKAEQAKAAVAEGEGAVPPPVPKPKKRWRDWKPARADKYPARDRSEMTGLEAFRHDDKMGGLPRKEFEPPKGEPLSAEYYLNKEMREFYSDILRTGEKKWGDLTPDEVTLLDRIFEPEEIEALKKAKPRLGPHGETLGEFQGVGYQGPDREQVVEEYRKWYASMAKPKPPAQGSLFGAQTPLISPAERATVVTGPQTPGGGYTPTGKGVVPEFPILDGMMQDGGIIQIQFEPDSPVSTASLKAVLESMNPDASIEVVHVKSGMNVANINKFQAHVFNKKTDAISSAIAQDIVSKSTGGEGIPFAMATQGQVRKWKGEGPRPAPQPLPTGKPSVEVLPPGEAYNIRKDALAKAKADAEYAKNLRAGTIERMPKPEVPAVQFTEPEKAKIAKDVTYLTSGSKTPAVWRKNPEQIEANRNELIKQALLKLPAATPEEIKKFVNNYAPNIRGERLQTRKEQAISKEGPYPIQETEEGAIDTSENLTKEMLPTAETGPKGKKPVGEQEVKYEKRQTKDIFTSDEESTRVLDTLSKAAGGDEKVLEILKSKLLSDTPESDLSLSKRIGVPKSSVSFHYRKALAKLKDSDEIKDIMKRHFVQLNVGPLPSKEQLRQLAKFANKFFTSTKGVDRVIDRQNDERLGSIAADAFEQTLNIGKLFKWVKGQNTPGLEGYLTDLVTGAIGGDGYTDIANSALPQNIKDVLTAFRTRTDALSDMIATEADVSPATRAAFDANMGKYLHKYYRLYEDKAWSPTDQQKAGFKNYLMQTHGMTAEEAEASMEADLAYARNDELLKPRHKRNTKAVPAGSFIKRKALSPEWKAFAGEIDRATWLMIKTTTDQAVTAHNAKFLSFLSDYLPDLWTDDAELAKRRGWQHSQLPGTYRYGKLRNKYVSPELNEYITREFAIASSGMEQAIQKFLITPYKWTKTIGSYPGHMRNMMGNTAFSILARCSVFNPLNAPYYARAVKAHLNRGKIGPGADLWKSLIKDGITETQYWGSEIPRLYDEMLQFEPSTWLEKLIDKTVKWPIDKLGELYNFGDSVYRVASHLKNTEHFHMTPTESANEINITFQNYRKLPVAVEFLRKYPVLGPFVSFTWNLGKIVGSQATKGVKEIKVPATRMRGLHRLALLLGVAMLPEIVSEISKKVNHFDSKQLDELEKYYPSYRRGGSFWYFRGDNGEPRIFDMSYIWPIGNLTRPLKGLLSGDAKGMLDALSFMNAPAIDAYQILVKGKDPQWGQDYPGFFDKVAAFAKLFYLPASSPIPSLPALLKGDIRPGTLTGPQFKAIIDAYNKQPYGKLQYEREFPTEVKNFVTGIRTWKLDPEKVLAQYIGSKRAEAQAEESRFTTWLRDNWKAKDWEIKNKSDATAERVKKVLADAEKAARLLAELKRDGFKITDKQDYNFRKEND